jgi:hypothetical protein
MNCGAHLETAARVTFIPGWTHWSVRDAGSGQGLMQGHTPLYWPRERGSPATESPLDLTPLSLQGARQERSNDFGSRYVKSNRNLWKPRATGCSPGENLNTGDNV